MLPIHVYICREKLNYENRSFIGYIRNKFDSHQRKNLYSRFVYHALSSEMYHNLPHELDFENSFVSKFLSNRKTRWTIHKVRQTILINKFYYLLLHIL
jgi:hypothetical protein